MSSNDDITALRAEIKRLRIENIQMQAALGYAIMAEDERHILPTNPYKCGTCDASSYLRAENERLRAALRDARVSVEGWADYASDYIKEKWDLKGDLARIDAALEGK